MSFPSNPSNGDTYRNPNNGITYVYSASTGSWDVYTGGNTPAITSVNKFAFTATTSQTSFSGLDDNGSTLYLPGQSIITLNGVVLEPTTDYTQNSSHIVLTTAASANDEVNMISFNTFGITDAVDAASLALTNTLAAASFDAANTANTVSIASFNNANSANYTALGAFNTANTANVNSGSAYNTANAAHTRANNGTFIVNTLDQLANVSSTGNSSTVLANTTHGGIFAWNSANVQANVALDSTRAVFIAPFGTTGSAGAWERVRTGPLSLKMFGATPDDISPSLNAFSAFVGNGTSSITFGKATLPSGNWNMSGPLMTKTQGLQIEGENGSVVKWTGAANVNMINVRDSSKFTLKDMIFLGNDSARPNSYIYFETISGDNTGTNEFMKIHDCYFGRKYGPDYYSVTGSVNGIILGGSLNGNNDTYDFRNLLIADCSNTGIAIFNNQSIWSMMENIVFDTCGWGIRSQSNLQGKNLCFNRNTVGDVLIWNNTYHKIEGFNSEHSPLLIFQYGGASITVDGGKALLDETLMTDTKWAHFTQAGNITFRNWFVDESALTGSNAKVLMVNSGSVYTATLSIKDCVLPKGNTRSGYQLTVGAGARDIVYDIQQDSFHAKGRLDMSAPFTSNTITNGSYSQTSQTSAVIQNTAPYLGALTATSNGGMIVVNGYSTVLGAAKIHNFSGSDISVGDGKWRWRRLTEKEIKSKASVTYDLPSLTINTGESIPFNIPCTNDDFVHWSAGLDWRGSFFISAHVGETNKAFLRMQCVLGAAVNAANATYDMYVIKKEAFDFIGSKVTDINVSNNYYTTISVSVPGTAVGDYCLSRFGSNLVGMMHSTEITAANTATVTIFNGTGADVNITSTVVEVGAMIGLS